MNLDAYKQLAKDVVELGKKLGADHVSVSLGNATSYQLEIRNQSVDLLKEAGSSGIDISLVKEQRRSSISSNDLSMDVLESLVQDTLQILPYMDQDQYYSLPDPKQQGRSEKDLQLVDPSYKDHTPQAKLEQTQYLETTTLQQDERLQVEHSYYSDMESHSVYADSNGFCDGFSKTFYSRGVSAFAEDHDLQGENTARKQTDGWYTCSRHFKNLDSLEDIAAKAKNRTLRKLGAVKPKSQDIPVVFSPEMASAFLGSLASAMMGDQIYRKNSFLRDRLNTEIASTAIRLQDNPAIPGAIGSRYFDSEGTQAKPLTLIEDGKLCNYMLSTYSGNKLDMKTTGHAGGISNLVLEVGEHTEQELIESVENGLYLTFMSGQGANITNGDYSRGAQGIWIQDGKLSHSVNEFTIASTFLGILSNIQMIANKPDTRSSILTPAFKVEKMSISGA